MTQKQFWIGQMKSNIQGLEQNQVPIGWGIPTGHLIFIFQEQDGVHVRVDAGVKPR
jgi:hypothetical protein